MDELDLSESLDEIFGDMFDEFILNEETEKREKVTWLLFEIYHPSSKEEIIKDVIKAIEPEFLE